MKYLENVILASWAFVQKIRYSLKLQTNITFCRLHSTRNYSVDVGGRLEAVSLRSTDYRPRQRSLILQR